MKTLEDIKKEITKEFKSRSGMNGFVLSTVLYNNQHEMNRYLMETHKYYLEKLDDVLEATYQAIRPKEMKLPTPMSDGPEHDLDIGYNQALADLDKRYKKFTNN